MSWKRWLFLFHRWVGIVLCAFFVLWFISGIFMMYVEFPQLTRPERFVGSPPLNFSAATVTPGQAVAKLKQRDFDVKGTPSRNEIVSSEHPDALADVQSVRLAMVWDRPVYVVHAQGGAQPRVVFADTGEVLRGVNAEQALQSAADFASRSGIPTTPSIDDKTIQTDQWTVSAALNDHRPLYKVALNDDIGTELYVSSRTGQVVRDSHTTERVLNYFAAVTHWLYPTFIRKYPDAWAWMVDILSGVGTIFVVSGLWIGVMRWRRKRAPGKPAVPYRGVMRWHYFTGVIFGLCVLTWVLSGLLSMNPGKLNPSRSPSDNQRQVYSGGELDVTQFSLPARLPNDAMEAELIRYDGQPFYNVTTRDGTRRLVSAADGEAALPSVEAMTERAAGLLPDAQIDRIDVLTGYDNYYYTRHPVRGDKPLPMIRIRFTDADRTWFYLDPVTGQVTERSTSINRLYRWLYNGLHSWDIRWLWERRPLWDIAVIAFMLGGTLLSAIGMVIGIRRLRY